MILVVTCIMLAIILGTCIFLVVKVGWPTNAQQYFGLAMMVLSVVGCVVFLIWTIKTFL